MDKDLGPGRERETDPERFLAHLRAMDAALARRIADAERARRLGLPLGAVALGGAGTLAALTASAVLATPVGWIAAGVAALLGLGALATSGTAGRREDKARDLSRRTRLSHAGRALEVDTLLARMDAARDAMAADYARFEARLMREVDPRRHADNAALLADLRARQLAFVARLDGTRGRAVTLRARLVKAAMEESAARRSAAIDLARETWEDGVHRARFTEEDAREDLARLTLETDALEALEREYETAI